MKLSKLELLEIKGGEITVTATLINALARGISVLFDLGKAVGSSIRRAITKTTCTL